MSSPAYMLEVVQVKSKRLFTRAEAEQYLGMGKETIYELVKSGDLPARLFRDRYLFRLEDLDQFIDSLEKYQVKKKTRSTA